MSTLFIQWMNCDRSPSLPRVATMERASLAFLARQVLSTDPSSAGYHMVWLSSRPIQQDRTSSSLWFQPTHLQNMLIKLDHFPKDRGEHRKYLKPPSARWTDSFQLEIWVYKKTYKFYKWPRKVHGELVFASYRPTKNNVQGPTL